MSLEAQFSGVERILRMPRSFHALLQHTCLPRETLNQVLTSMIIQGRVKKAGGVYMLNGGAKSG